MKKVTKPNRLKRAADWIKDKVRKANELDDKAYEYAKDAIVQPNRLKRFNKWSKNRGLDVAGGTIHATKAIANETRETIIAGKIAGKLIKKKPVTAPEKRFLKSQTKDVLKAVPIAGVAAASTALAPGIPGATETYIALAKPLGLGVGTQTIPRAYMHQHKWKKLNNFLDRSKQKVDKARERVNGK